MRILRFFAVYAAQNDGGGTRHFFFEDFFDDFFDDDDFFDGTFAPERRASDSPMAMACLRLFTFLPELPLFSVPRLRSCIAFSTFFDAFLLYLRAMRLPPAQNRVQGTSPRLAVD